MKIQEHVSLASYTTLHVGGPAQYFVSVRSLEELREAITFAKEQDLDIFVLGGGSNICVADAGVQGLVIKNDLRGITFCDASDNHTVDVLAQAGEDWDAFVEAVVAEELWGVENLSAIPGTVGATPIQNVGAYGVEVKDCITWVEAVSITTGELRRFTNHECQFEYRGSFFKTKEGREYIVTTVCFTLAKRGTPKLAYKDLEKYFSLHEGEPTLEEIRNAVIEIRANKFPDYTMIGTAGSFFKMPIVPTEVADTLKKKYEKMPMYPVDERRKKIIIAWILDHILHTRGLKMGPVGVYEKHSLVLVAYDNACADDVYALTQKITADVKNVTGLDIETEVTFVGEW